MNNQEQIKHKILLIDDEDEVFVRDFRELFEDYFDIERVYSGFEALSKVNNSDYHLVITDMKLNKNQRGFEGCQVMSFIKKIKPKISVIGMTNYKSDNLQIDVKRNGGEILLSKDLDTPIKLMKMFHDYAKKADNSKTSNSLESIFIENKNINDPLNIIQGMIINGRIKEGIEKLLKLFIKEELKQELRLIKASYNRLCRNKRKQLINDENYNVNENKITDSLLDIIQEIQNEL